MSKAIQWPTWPRYGKRHKEAVIEVIESNQIFAATKVREFEEKFTSFLGDGQSVGVSNATTGLHLALAALGVGKGDEVVVTPYSWISSASSILMQNAVPIFADIEDVTFGINPEEVKSKITDKTKAVICVHMFGNPCNLDDIMSICVARNIPLIEDASHAHGAEHNGRAIGTFADLSVFSLHQRKNLSVGEGGIVFSKNKDLAEKIRRLRSFGHEELSYNYRMTEFAGALGIVGLENIRFENELRNAIANYLSKGLESNHYLELVTPRSHDYGVFHAALLKVNKVPEGGLDLLLENLRKCGIPIKKTWSPLHLHPHFNPTTIPPRGVPWRENDYLGLMHRKRYSELHLPVTAEFVPNRLLELPIHPPTSRLEIDFFLEKLEEFTKNRTSTHRII
jgi:perosamine synthetase